jgi:phosphoenolpyruvate synthase/pyruvate phosphate dikinase
MEVSMSTFVLPLSDPQATLENVGGKGMSLARLSRAGLPVPPGFHLTTQAYWCFVTANGIQPCILEALKGLDLSDPQALEAASRQINLLFSQGSIPSEIAHEVTAAYSGLSSGQAAVAVRSSATVEDLPEASFAGQQETYLNVCGADAVLEAVRQCWASLWTGRAIAYRARQNIDPTTVSLAVVVQELVFAEAAGVLFTANPVNGQRDEMIITAAWGLGEAIVSGAVTPDTLTVKKSSGKVLQREISEKKVMTVRSASGVEQVSVPRHLAKKAVLSKAQAVELVMLGAQIEALYAMPMDIEWTLSGRKFAIVQARPVTALQEPPLEWPVSVSRAVMARGSFAEFVPEPVTPLFATLAVPIARKVTVELMARVGVTGKDSYLFSVINSYVYVGFVFTPKMVWQMAKATASLSRILSKNAEPQAEKVKAESLEVVQKWQTQPLAELSPSQILVAVREIFLTTANSYAVAQSGTIPLSSMDELSFSQFYKRLVKRKGDPEPAIFLYGAESKAMRADKALFDLAGWAKGQPGLAEYLLGTPAETIWAEIQAGAPVAGLEEFGARFAGYLKDYGHAIYDLDFAKPLPCDQPAPLLETVKVYLGGRNSPYVRQQEALERRAQAAQSIIKRLDWLRRRWFIKLLKAAQASAPMREDSILDLGLGYPLLRRMLGELGRRLAEGAAIGEADDIYWLEAQEVEEMANQLERGEALPDFTAAVAQRKTKWQAMRRITAPSTLPQKSWLARFFPGEGASGETLKGYGVSAGQITGTACVMLGPEDFGLMHSGDIIVAGITTPAWTPLFARAAGIVTDIGGPLSHSSIVAREYGLPAVLGTGSATRRIQTGQVITVDGSAGTVTLKR